MAAPAFGSVGTYTVTGSGAGANIDVPDSVAVNDIIVVSIYIENTDTVTTLPSGFTEAPNSPSPTGLPGTIRHHVFWKRATAADSTAGTYNFAWTNSTYSVGFAARYTGAVTSGDPWDVTGSSATASANVSPPAITLTTTGPDRLLIYTASSFNSTVWTAPTGFTKRVDQGSNDNMLCDLAQAAAGSTGSLQGVGANSTHGAWVGALKPVAGASISGSAAAALGALTATASGTPKVTGSASAPLGSLTATASGTPKVTASATAALGRLTATASGIVARFAAAAAPLGSLNATVQGTPTVIGSAAAPLGRLTATASATAMVSGTATAPLGPLAAAAAGSGASVAAATAPLGQLTAAAAATALTHPGHVLAVLGRLTATADGTRAATGAAVAQLGGLHVVAVAPEAIVFGSMRPVHRQATSMHSMARAAASMRGAL